MRVDGLTTAKILAIATHLCFNRKIRLKHDQDEERERLVREIDIFKKTVKKGISREKYISGLEELGYKGIEYLMGRKEALEFYNEGDEYLFPDNALEDDGTDSKIESKVEEGFVGLKQIVAEEEVLKENTQNKATVE